MLRGLKLLVFHHCQWESFEEEVTPPPPQRGNVSAPGARRASFVTRAQTVDCCR